MEQCEYPDRNESRAYLCVYEFKETGKNETKNGGIRDRDASIIFENMELYLQSEGSLFCEPYFLRIYMVMVHN